MRRSGLGAGIRLAVTLSIVAAVVFFAFPILFAPRVEVPEKVQYGSASSVMFQIANQNLTPLRAVEYSCEVSRLVLTSGAAVRDANVLNRGRFPRIAGRRAALGRCQTGYIVTMPVKAAEYKLTVTYTAYPWTARKVLTVRIAAQFDAKNEVTGWKTD
ncbi:MAG TPA: hypothetical protein VKT49_19885 [Bryobacteraceae bacterium]|nr:hypothetical protein [Bryobacteraceae bacterium]